MPTDNEADQAQVDINRTNADAKTILTKIESLLVRLDERVPVNLAFDNAITAIDVQIAILDDQIDVEFPVVKLPL